MLISLCLGFILHRDREFSVRQDIQRAAFRAYFALCLLECRAIEAESATTRVNQRIRRWLVSDSNGPRRGSPNPSPKNTSSHPELDSDSASIARR